MKNLLVGLILILNQNSVSAGIFNADTICNCEKIKKILLHQNIENDKLKTSLEKIDSLLLISQHEKIELEVKCCSKSTMDNNFKDYIPIIIVFITGLVALIQLRLNHIKNYRIEWIKDFKENVSNYISFLNLLNSKTSNMNDAIKNLDNTSNTYEADKKNIYTTQYIEIEKLNSQADKSNSLIRLSLSPVKNINLIKDLEEFANKSMNAYENRNMDEEKIMNELLILEKSILNQANVIIDSEWKKIKSFL